MRRIGEAIFIGGLLAVGFAMLVTMAAGAFAHDPRQVAWHVADAGLAAMWVTLGVTFAGLLMLVAGDVLEHRRETR